MRAVLASFSVALVSLGGCSLFLDFSGIADGCDGPCTDVGVDSPSDGGEGGAFDGGGDGSCKGTSGPASVKVGSFCIDSTEVTNAQYNQFLDAVGQGFVPDEPTGCTSKSSFAPATSGSGCTSQTFDPTNHANYPVPCVDWCDAWAYCAWAGKRLCGEVGGGAITFDFAQVMVPSAEWYAACTDDGGSYFPWGGNNPDDARCNTTCSNLGDGGAIPVGTDTTCTTPTGIADMGGNQLEWLNSCGGPAANDNCFEQGDSFQAKTGGYCSDCSANHVQPRNSTSVDMGIRCCSDTQ